MLYLWLLRLECFQYFLFPKVINLLNKNLDYQDSTKIFIILIVGIVISSSYIPLNNLFLMANYPEIQTKFMFLIVSFNIIMNFVLIPFLDSLELLSQPA